MKGSRAFLYLGRGVHYAIAREGALKLKESAYLQAEGYPAGELKHGPNALVSPDAPLVVIATRDPSDPDAMLRYRKVLQLMKDMRAQGATILVIATEGDEEAAGLANHCIEVPKTEDMLATMLEVVPLQLLAYQLAIQNGIDVDQSAQPDKSRPAGVDTGSRSSRVARTGDKPGFRGSGTGFELGSRSRLCSRPQTQQPVGG